MARDRVAVRALGVIVVSLSLGLACGGTTPAELEEPLPPPLEDAIPYEALGAGTLVFQRITSGDGSVYAVDASARRAWGVIGYGGAPAVSPDGERVAVTRLAPYPLETAYDVHVVNIDGSGLANVSQVPRQDRAPSWTPDGQVVFYTAATPGHALHRQSPVADPPDRTTITILICGGGECFDPRGRISLSVHRQFVLTTRGGIYRMEQDGSDLTLILEAPPFTSLHSPVWSPDAAHIAYLAHVGDATAEWVALRVSRMDPDGGDVTTLAESQVPGVAVWMDLNFINNTICWSPNGAKLVFTRPESDTVSHLWVINADGSGLTQVTSQPGAFDKSVTWGR